MQLGMDLSSVISIQSMPGALSRQPEKHNLFAPLMEAQNISLINLSAILDNENYSADPEIAKLIVVKTPNKPVGLIVERVDRVIKTDTNRIEPLSPIFQGPALSCFPRVFKHEGRLVLLLAPQTLVDIVRQMRKSQGNATFSAGEPDPVIQRCMPAGVLYKKYAETGEEPSLYIHPGKLESC